MSLKKYWSKRDFSKTPEPRGKVLKGKKNIFVIQNHFAERAGHHHDLRLEMGGVLKSWAIPKGVPQKEGVKRLAVEVEDHAVEYARFEGVIPAGQYGAGTVEIFDQGKYKLIEQDKNKIIFELRGKKIKGPHALIRMKNTKNWLIWKIKE